jgi:hypothetical protein
MLQLPKKEPHKELLQLLRNKKDKKRDKEEEEDQDKDNNEK